MPDLPTAQGTRVELGDGRSVLDATSGLGAAPFGHRHPTLLAAAPASAAEVGDRLRALVPEELVHVALLAEEAEALLLARELAARAAAGRPGPPPVVVQPGLRADDGRPVAPAALDALRRDGPAASPLLVADERLSGLGRTGALLAVDHALLAPDVLVLGAALSGGLAPIGAVLWTDRVDRGARRPGPLPARAQPSPTALAAALATTDLLLAGDWREATARIAHELAAGLEPLAGVAGIEATHVLGALATVLLAADVDAAAAVRAALDHGVLLEPGPRHLLVRPPLTASSQEVARTATGLRAAARAAARA